MPRVRPNVSESDHDEVIEPVSSRKGSSSRSERSRKEREEKDAARLERMEAGDKDSRGRDKGDKDSRGRDKAHKPASGCGAGWQKVLLAVLFLCGPVNTVIHLAVWRSFAFFKYHLICIQISFAFLYQWHRSREDPPDPCCNVCAHSVDFEIVTTLTFRVLARVQSHGHGSNRTSSVSPQPHHFHRCIRLPPPLQLPSRRRVLPYA